MNNGMDRREFLRGAVLAAAATGPSALRAVARAGKAGSAAPDWIDTNVSLFQWPCRRLALDQTDALVARLRSHGFHEAWAGSFEGVLHRDIGGVNERLAEECRRFGGRALAPFGTVNPTLPDWEEDIRRCHELWSMQGIRLFPNYHGYTLDDPRFNGLIALPAERSLLIQLAVLLEDTRTQNRLMRVKDVDVTPLIKLMPRHPRARVLLLNGGKALPGLLDRFAATPGLYHEIARADASGTVGRMARALPPGRVVFGSHAPFFTFESALIKLDETDLPPEEVHAVLAGNARQLLSRA
jgi:predicted TIM-barrel fold metal-dependent hydrolase